MPVNAPRVRVNVICRRGDEVLLVRHEKPGRTYWLLPGGGLEFGESLAACAVREVREETGLHVDVERPIWLSEAIDPDGQRHILNVYLLAHIVGGELVCSDESIIAEVSFKAVAELTALTLYPPVADRLVDLHAADYSLPMAYIGELWL